MSWPLWLYLAICLIILWLNFFACIYLMNKVLRMLVDDYADNLVRYRIQTGNMIDCPRNIRRPVRRKPKWKNKIGWHVRLWP